jgi:hypothetical protein
VKKSRVYPAEKDPRQDHGDLTIHEAAEWDDGWQLKDGDIVPIVADTTRSLAREFGPWVRAADGSWMRRKARKR